MLPHVSIARWGWDDVRVWTSKHSRRPYGRSVNDSLYEMEDNSSYHKVINDDDNKTTETYCKNSSNNKELADAATRDEDDDAEWDDDDFELNDFDVELKAPNTKASKDDVTTIAADIEESTPSSNQDDDWFQSLSETTSRQDDTNTTGVPSDADDDGGVFLTKQFQRLGTPVSKKKSRCAACTRPKQDEKSIYCKQCEKAPT